MPPAYLVLTLIALAALCALVGARGILRGQEVIDARGPDTLMHYPAPLPWLRKKVSAARWVVWVGRLYGIAGIACLTGAWVVWTAQHRPLDTKPDTCLDIAHQVLSIHTDALRGGSTTANSDTEGCSSALIDARGVRWFTIRSTPTTRLLGHGFVHNRGEFERRGFTIQVVDGIGQRAAIAIPTPTSGLNSVLLFDDARGHHQIEMNTRTLNAAGQSRLIAGLGQRVGPGKND
jgi:hypothetical protein